VAARSAELGPRRPLGRVVLGERLVLWRTPGGRVAAALDRCLHRNMPLSRGEVFDGLLGCPYHGWTYDAEGRCVAVPAEGPEATPFRAARLETFPVREQHGLVWVWMAAGHRPDRDPCPRPHWGERGWSHHVLPFRVRGGATDVAENFMDVPHTLFVHRGLFRRRSRRRLPATIERREEEILVTYHEPGDRVGPGGRLLNPRGRPLVHTDRFIMPANVRVDYAFGQQGLAISVLNACTPVTEEETRVTAMIAVRAGVLAPLARLLVPVAARVIMRQDRRTVAAQTEVLRHHGGPAYHSTPADAVHVHLETLRAWAVSGGGAPRPATVVENVDIWV